MRFNNPFYTNLTKQTDFQERWAVLIEDTSFSLYVHTGREDITIAGKTFKGRGLVEQPTISQTSELKKSTFSLEFIGAENVVGLTPGFSLGLDMAGAKVAVYKLFFDSSGLRGFEPYQTGVIETNGLAIQGRQLKVILQCAGRLSNFDLVNLSELSHQRQLEKYPGDLGFEFVEPRNVNWHGRYMVGNEIERPAL